MVSLHSSVSKAIATVLRSSRCNAQSRMVPSGSRKKSRTQYATTPSTRTPPVATSVAVSARKASAHESTIGGKNRMHKPGTPYEIRYGRGRSGSLNRNLINAASVIVASVCVCRMAHRQHYQNIPSSSSTIIGSHNQASCTYIPAQASGCRSSCWPRSESQNRSASTKRLHTSSPQLLYAVSSSVNAADRRCGALGHAGPSQRARVMSCTVAYSVVQQSTPLLRE